MPGEEWPQEVSSYAIDDGARLLLFDPLSVPDELLELAANRETAIVLTAPWHERDAQSLVERLGAPVYTPLPDTAQDLMDMYGVTAEQAGDGSPDLLWLLREKKGEACPYSSGDRLPFGADVFPGHKANDTVLWVESQRAVISGDTLVDFGSGFEINERWLRPGVTREEIAEGLRPLLALPVEVVLPVHGAPTDRAALERALS
jgi:glyoxylase-like metal-dependent hydrolase (beta-lactamase superfamily II)